MTYRLALARSAERTVGELPERYAVAILGFIVGPLLESPRRLGGELAERLRATTALAWAPTG